MSNEYKDWKIENKKEEEAAINCFKKVFPNCIRAQYLVPYREVVGEVDSVFVIASYNVVKNKITVLEICSELPD